MNARNGKIVRLPRSVRNQLNERLERSEESPQLLEWLNALPEARKIVQNDFAGVPISKQNLSGPVRKFTNVFSGSGRQG